MKHGPAILAALLLTTATFVTIAVPAFAQDAPTPPADIPGIDSGAATKTDPLPLAPVLPSPVDPATLLKPGAAPNATTPAAKPAPKGGVVLDARLTEDGEPIPTGLVWRVFGEKQGGDGRLPLVREEKGGVVRLPLPPGGYVVNAAYGKATVTRKIDVTADTGHETLVLNAGGLKLSAVVGKDQPLADDQVEFDLYPGTDEADPESNPIATDIPPNQIIRLNTGIYHVVSRYGDANAAVRADIKVEAGKLTEATLFQKAARITLKLVSETGGEALANTSWSVLTAGGDSVFDSVGAFPDVVLAIGDYTAVAKHDNQIHERNFTVESGRNREVEVLAK